MRANHSDAFVFFGASGDFAYKQIFPALQALIRRGGFEVPIIGVAKSNWNLDQLRGRARESLQHHGGVDEAVFAKLSAQLRYVDGDYRDRSTYERYVRHSEMRINLYTTWRFRPACLPMLLQAWPNPVVRRMPELWLRSLLVAISLPRRRWTARSTSIFLSRRFFASTLSRKRAGAEPALLSLYELVS